MNAAGVGRQQPAPAAGSAGSAAGSIGAAAHAQQTQQQQWPPAWYQDLSAEAQSAVQQAARSALNHWSGRVVPECMQRAISLGVTRDQVDEAVNVAQAISRRKLEEERQRKSKQLKDLLRSIKAYAYPADGPRKAIDPSDALKALDMFREYHWVVDNTGWRAALTLGLLGAQPSQMVQGDQKRVKDYLQGFVVAVVYELRKMNVPGLETCKYLQETIVIFRGDHPLYKSVIGRPDIRNELLYRFFIEEKGLGHLASYMAVRSTTAQFPQLELVLSFLNSVVELLPYKRATDRRKEFLKADANVVWEAVRPHINSLPLDESRKQTRVISMVCGALVKIDPSLKDACLGYSAEDSTNPVPVTPSNSSSTRSAKDFFSAIESAKGRLNSFRRMTASAEQSVRNANENVARAEQSVQTARAAVREAKSSLDLAVKEVEDARSYLASMKSKGLTALIDYATNRVAMANTLKKSTAKSAKNVEKAFEEARKGREIAKKALAGAKSDHNFAIKETEDATSYLEELYKENEVIDVDAESPVRKKQRAK